MEKWNKEMEDRIIRESKFTLTLRIVRVVLTILLIYIFYSFIVNWAAEGLHKTKEHHYYSALAMEWSVPNIQADLTTFTKGKTNDLGFKESSYDFYKRVGTERKYVGTMEMVRRYTNGMSEQQLIKNKELTTFTFNLPEDPRNGRKLNSESVINTWATLDKLPEGTVAELAFSTTSLMEAKELLSLLESYDLDVLWMPLYSGELDKYTPSFYSTSNESITIFDILGLTPIRKRLNDYSIDMYQTELSLYSIDDSQDSMLKNMSELLQKGDDYYSDFLGLQNLEKQYNYLKENGFKVYGAVVTGPTKELLKLENLGITQGEQLGEVDFWNWYVKK